MATNTYNFSKMTIKFLSGRIEIHRNDSGTVCVRSFRGQFCEDFDAIAETERREMVIFGNKGRYSDLLPVAAFRLVRIAANIYRKEVLAEEAAQVEAMKAEAPLKVEVVETETAYSVLVDGLVTMPIDVPKSWAVRAVEVLSNCANRYEQREQFQRITVACRAAA